MSRQATEAFKTACMNGALRRAQELLNNPLLYDLRIPDHEATRLFFRAVENGYLHITHFLYKNFDITLNNEVDGETPLIAAIRLHRNTILPWLVAWGANVGYVIEGDTPLIMACAQDNNQCIKLLARLPSAKIDHVNAAGLTALHILARHGNITGIKYLLFFEHPDAFKFPEQVKDVLKRYNIMVKDVLKDPSKKCYYNHHYCHTKDTVHTIIRLLEMYGRNPEELRESLDREMTTEEPEEPVILNPFEEPDQPRVSPPRPKKNDDDTIRLVPLSEVLKSLQTPSSSSSSSSSGSKKRSLVADDSDDEAFYDRRNPPLEEEEEEEEDCEYDMVARALDEYAKEMTRNDSSFVDNGDQEASDSEGEFFGPPGPMFSRKRLRKTPERPGKALKITKKKEERPATPKEKKPRVAKFGRLKLIASDDDEKTANFELPRSSSTSIVSCSLCSASVMESPQTLPCLHSFCFKCLCKRFPDLKEKHKCPECMAPFDYHHQGTDNNIIIELTRLSDLKASHDPNHVKCQLCDDEEATRICHQCDKIMGAQCLVFHERLHHAHQLSSLDEIFCDKHLSVNRPRKCSRHPKMALEIWCESCTAIVCPSCITERHSDHRFKPWKTDDGLTPGVALTSEIRSMQAQIESVRVDTEAVTEKHLQTLQGFQQARPQWQALITECTDKVMAMLIQRREEMRQHVAGIEKEMLQHLEALQHVVYELRGFEKFVEALLTQTTPIDIAGMYNQIRWRFRTLLELRRLEKAMTLPQSVPDPSLDPVKKVVDALVVWK